MKNNFFRNNITGALLIIIALAGTIAFFYYSTSTLVISSKTVQIAVLITMLLFIAGLVRLVMEVLHNELLKKQLEKLNKDLFAANKKIKEELKDSEESSRFLSDFMPQLVWRSLPNGDHDYFNKRWYEYTGCSYEDTKNKGWSLVLHPDDYERTVKIWQHSLQTGEPYNIEYRFRRYDGEYRWFLGKALPMKGEDGKIIKWFGTCTDIEEQRTAKEELERIVNERTKELRELNKELSRSNQELEQFAYVASHDLQEPLRKIQAFGDRIVKKFADQLQDDGREYIQRMQSASSRMQVLINDLLNYSRVSRNQSEKELLDLNEIVNDVMQDLERPLVVSEAEIIIESLPMIKGDRRQLGQLFQNLISNALKFKKNEVKPVIKITCNKISPENHLDFKLPLNEEYFQIAVIDNGIGFNMQYAEKIFTIFQRLHGRNEYSGTGIGLAICKKVAENHLGTITASSSPGEGSIFYIFLPVPIEEAIRV